MSDDHKMAADEPMGLDMEDGPAMVDLKIGEVSFPVSVKAASVSTMIAAALENDQDATSIDILSGKASTLAWIVAYMKIHDGIEAEMLQKPNKHDAKSMAEITKDARDAAFIVSLHKKNGVAGLYAVMLMANYMGMVPLLHIGAAMVAFLSKGKTPEEIKKILDTDVDADKSVEYAPPPESFGDA